MDQVSGTVRYEDGSLIPSKSIIVRFEPLASPLDEKTHAKAGNAQVDPADGSFESVTTYKYGDGIVRGRHKVLFSERAAAPGAAQAATKKLVPEEYRDSATTPLEIDSGDSPFEFKISKP
jgi:hypothetical protein